MTTPHRAEKPFLRSALFHRKPALKDTCTVQCHTFIQFYSWFFSRCTVDRRANAGGWRSRRRRRSAPTSDTLIQFHSWFIGWCTVDRSCLRNPAGRLSTWSCWPCNQHTLVRRLEMEEASAQRAHQRPPALRARAPPHLSARLTVQLHN